MSQKRAEKNPLGYCCAWIYLSVETNFNTYKEVKSSASLSSKRLPLYKYVSPPCKSNICYTDNKKQIQMAAFDHLLACDVCSDVVELFMCKCHFFLTTFVHVELIVELYIYSFNFFLFVTTERAISWGRPWDVNYGLLKRLKIRKERTSIHKYIRNHINATRLWNRKGWCCPSFALYLSLKRISTRTLSKGGTQPEPDLQLSARSQA